jgi:hypothetical protein
VSFHYWRAVATEGSKGVVNFGAVARAAAASRSEGFVKGYGWRYGTAGSQTLASAYAA